MTTIICFDTLWKLINVMRKLTSVWLCCVTALKKQQVELAHELHLALMINHTTEVQSLRTSPSKWMSATMAECSVFLAVCSELERKLILLLKDGSYYSLNCYATEYKLDRIKISFNVLYHSWLFDTEIQVNLKRHHLEVSNFHLYCRN